MLRLRRVQHLVLQLRCTITTCFLEVSSGGLLRSESWGAVPSGCSQTCRAVGPHAVDGRGTACVSLTPAHSTATFACFNQEQLPCMCSRSCGICGVQERFV